MVTTEPGTPARTTTPESPTGAPPSTPSRFSRLGTLAAVLGGLGALLALLFPFLPVVQDTARITWPSPVTGTQSVDAPLVAYRPQSMTARVPCAAVQSLDARSPQPATVFSTTPPLSPAGARVGMTLSVEGGQLVLTDRGQQTATAPVPAGACTIAVDSDDTATTVDLGNGQPITTSGDLRPQVVGIYSDLDTARDPIAGTSVSVVSDTRFESSPTLLKGAAGLLAALCVAGSVWALHRLDVRAGRRSPRWTPRRWWRPTLRDGVVVVVLAVWAVIGSQTSDDGYILGIARARESAGYIGNYYRWFNVPEAPFGWFYELYALWTRVGDSVLWMRLPSLLLGIVSWLLISREMLPRLGRQVRRSPAAGWAAATVFLLFWLPYNNGLRPEPVAVIAALVAYGAVERAVATRRLVPLALGLVAAALAVAATPTGLMAFAPFLAAARPLYRLLQQRTRLVGRLPILLPLAGAAVVVLVVIFADQTWAAVSEASRVRFLIGPNLQWFDELVRYQRLFSSSADGSLARRAPVLLLFLGLAVCLAILLRRGRLPGAALGASQRLIGSSLVGLLVLALTPTKWTHHFGAFAALGAGMAALTAVATSSVVLRSRRNRAFFLGAVLATLGLSVTGPNTWWYTSNWGVPWFDKPPSYQGYQLSTLFLLLAAVVVGIGALEHIRGRPEDRPPPPAPGRVRRAAAALAAPLRRLPRPGEDAVARRRRFTAAARAAPIAVLAGLLVLFELASMAKAADKQVGSFSLGGDVLTHPFGGTCGLVDDVRLEGSPLAGVLRAVPAPAALAPSPPGVLPTIAPPAAPRPPGVPPAPAAPLPAGVYPSTSPEAQLVEPGPIDVGFHHDDAVPPIGGGTGASGADYTLRNALAPAVLGTFDAAGTATGVLRTDWFAVGDDVRSGQTPLVVTAAGRLSGGNALTLQYARRLPDGRLRIVGQEALDDGQTGEPPWRELRVDLSRGAGADADVVRLVAQDRLLGPDGWLAVAPMRAPQLVPATQVLGGGTPMYLEWPVQFASPCLQPFAVRDGIAQVPQYRLQADDSQLREGGLVWSDASSGGPLGWIDVLAREEEVPSFLQGEPSRDWGRLSRLVPYAAGTAAPTVQRGERTVWGWTTEGQIGAAPPGIPSPTR